MIAIVTGASSGIGAAVSKSLVKSGHTVIGISRDSGKLNALGDELGPNFLPRPCDVTDTKTFTAVLRSAVDDFSRVDLLVNCAGSAKALSIDETPPEEFRATHELNVVAPAAAIHALWPAMCRHGGSRIVNVSSLAQLDPLPGFFAYASSKSALHLLTVVANAEGEPHDIRAFTVAPGVVDTPLHRTLVPGGLPPVDGQSSVLQADDVARVILEIAEGKHDRRAGWVLAMPAPAAVSSLTQWVADHPGGGAEIVEATRNSEFLGSALTAHEPSVSPTPPPRVAILRHEHFNSAHRIHNPALSDADNKRIYGKCNNPNYHGHNYEIAVRVAGPVDPVIGYVMDLGELSSAIRQHVLERLDHMNLNLDVPEFRDVNPTAENIAVVIYGLLRPHVPQRLDLHVTLCETPRNIVQYPADIVVAP